MLTVAQEVLTTLAQGNTVAETCAAYFNTIHFWMPIISKRRMDLGIPLRNAGPDLAMLFLAMKLVTSQPDEGATESPFYLASKNFLSVLEAKGEVSLLCLQAMVLVAIYEYGHAVYPAAWMTVGACARYADILGISCGRDCLDIMGQYVCVLHYTHCDVTP
jgi:hypothetical protein